MPTSDAFSPALALTLAFAAALTLGLVLKFWLATRQIRHVARHRSDVPAPFAERIALAAHQKAADYTITKAVSYTHLRAPRDTERSRMPSSA